MLFVLSPAKKLDFDTPATAVDPSQPSFTDAAGVLIEIMREKTPAQVASLMSISDKLAVLNVARYAAWHAKHTAKNSKPAILAFNGDVYDGLDASTLKKSQLNWAQQHLLILSGLYGVLQPLDWMQPYRLEMGTSLPNPKGKDLYAFWTETVTGVLQKRMAKEKTPVLINLASQEYFKVIDTKKLGVPVVQCVFEDYKNGKYKMVSFYAKRARGLMARYAIENKITTPEGLKDFSAEGYAYSPAASTSERWVFRRKT